MKKGYVLRFTGLSGSGKSTIADALFEELVEGGVKNIERLDGDIVRESLSSDLGFTKEDRAKNIQRVAFVSSLLSKHGIGVISSFVSPYESVRQSVRNSVTNFIEVFVDTPLNVCEQRDVKGLYKRARAGKIENFTGISDVYESPISPEIHLKTEELTVAQSVNQILTYLQQNSYISL